jgi:two-component system sensor histidine kinase/response regulator
MSHSADPMWHYHVLLAEDAQLNQQLVSMLLKRFGCRVDVVATGQEAIEAFNKGTYDMILMDCEMPVMDGLQAAREIREQEMKKKLARIPIIALTAQTRKEDIEACLAAGMDDHVCKPFKQEDILHTLQRWGATPRNMATQAEDQAEDKKPADAENQQSRFDRSVIDQLRLLQTEGAPDVISTLIELYLQESPQLIQQMSNAIANSDRETLYRAAHTLKSSSGNVGARNLAELCGQLETEARGGVLDDVRSLYNGINREFDYIRNVLENEILVKASL